MIWAVPAFYVTITRLSEMRRWGDTPAATDISAAPLALDHIFRDCAREPAELHLAGPRMKEDTAAGCASQA